MGAPKRILIIEDEKPLREAFAFLLQSEGFDVDSAENGEIGLRKLTAFKPDLILLDMLMPVMNGVEFLKAIDIPAHFPKLKTVMLSNLSDPLTLDDTQIYGVSDSILKADLSPADLVVVVRRLLNIK